MRWIRQYGRLVLIATLTILAGINIIEGDTADFASYIALATLFVMFDIYERIDQRLKVIEAFMIGYRARKESGNHE